MQVRASSLRRKVGIVADGPDEDLDRFIAAVKIAADEHGIRVVYLTTSYGPLQVVRGSVRDGVEYD